MTGHLNAAKMRYRVDPGDVPPEKAARRLYLTLEHFKEVLPNLIKRGFPQPDPDTGMFDLEAIDVWRKSRHGQKSGLTGTLPSEQPPTPSQMSMGERFAAKKQSRHG